MAYWTRRFNPAFTRALQKSLAWRNFSVLSLIFFFFFFLGFKTFFIFLFILVNNIKHWFMSRINPIPRIDTYFFKVHLILSSRLRLGLPESLFPIGLPAKVLIAVLPFLHSGYMSCPSQFTRFNHPDYIKWMVRTMKFLIVEPSPIPILSVR